MIISTEGLGAAIHLVDVQLAVLSGGPFYKAKEDVLGAARWVDIIFKKKILYRQWYCQSDKVTCQPGSKEDHYLHQTCHWYWHLDQDRLKQEFPIMFEGTG